METGVAFTRNTRVKRSTISVSSTRPKFRLVRCRAVVDRCASLAIPGEIRVTGASIRSLGVSTGSICVARVGQTLVDISTRGYSITRISRLTGTSERTFSVLTNTRSRQTIVGPSRTLIDVGTGLAVSSKTRLTGARVATNGVGTDGVIRTRSRGGTFIDIGTGLSVATITNVTCTRVRSRGVCTDGVSVARVSQTLVDVGTGLSIAGIPRFTSTRDARVKRTTNCVRGARSKFGRGCRAVVNSCASLAVSGIVLVTGTSVRSGGVCTHGVGVAGAGQTLVDVGTSISVASVASLA